MLKYFSYRRERQGKLGTDGKPKSLWQTEYDALRPAVQAAHDDFFRFIESRQIGEWNSGDWKRLRREASDLGEFRFKCQNVQWRVIGRLDEKEMEFTYLIMCNHKDKIYQPPDCIATAVSLWNEIKSDPNMRVPCARAT